MAICPKHGISEMECDCPQWSSEALAAIKEQAEAVLAHVGLDTIGEQMQCFCCGLPLRVHWNGPEWNVACVCGWCAAGLSPRPAN